MNHTTSISQRRPTGAGTGTDLSLSVEAMRRILSKRLRDFSIFVGALLLAFLWPLIQWARFGIKTDTYSYILLIPAISAYLVWLKRGEIPLRVKYNIRLSVGLFGLGALVLLGYWIARWLGWDPVLDDRVSLTMFAFILLFLGGFVFFLGTRILQALQFPVLFLFFMVPFPTIVNEWIEIFYQHTSAEASYVLLKLSGTPVFRHGLLFQLPGIVMEVARECSGIRSSLVLLISSLLAGHLLLESTWRKVALTLFVIPLGIFRNAIRILTIGLLCVHISPDMINSVIHRRGGPVFFVLSLIPFFILLVILKRTEKRTDSDGTAAD